MSSNSSFLVDFVLRSDAFSKPGGDTIQALAYADELRANGMDVQVSPFGFRKFRPRPGACVHVFNVDQPFELLHVIAGSTKNDRFFISPIHHSRFDVRAMRRGRSGSTLAERLLPENLRAVLVFVLSAVRHPGPWRERAGCVLRALVRFPRLTSHIGSALDKASAVFLLSETEGRALRTDFNWHGHNGLLTPNGRPHLEDLQASPDARILVVGRIEPRKRQLELLSAADRLGVPVVFVGAGNPNQRSYVSKFEEAIQSSTRSEWLRSLSHDDVVELMQASRVLINASWVEVQSLVDLEAACAGCWVVTTKDGGSSREWLGSGVVQFGKDQLVEAVQEAERLRTSSSRPPVPDYAHTWASTSATIARAYQTKRAS